RVGSGNESRGGHLAHAGSHRVTHRFRAALRRPWRRSDPGIPLSAPSPAATTPALAKKPARPAGDNGRWLGYRPGLAPADARHRAPRPDPGRPAPAPGYNPAAA